MTAIFQKLTLKIQIISLMSQNKKKGQLLANMKQMKKQKQMQEKEQQKLRQQKMRQQLEKNNKKNQEIIKRARSLQSSKIVSENENGKKAKGMEQKSINFRLFKQYSFCFPLRDIDLSAKTIQLLTNNIVSRSGKIIELIDSMEKTHCDYILVSRKAKLPQKLEYGQILDYRYINHCVNNNSILSRANYVLYDGIDEDKEDTIQNQLQKLQDQEQQDEERDIVKKARLLNDGTEVKDQANRKHDKYNQKPNKNNYMCNAPDFANRPMNKLIIEKLSELMKIHTFYNDLERKRTLIKAVSKIKYYPRDISNEDQLRKVKLGAKTKQKIREIILTGDLQRIHQIRATEKSQALQQLTKVWGLGPGKANKLYDDYHIKGVEDLRKLMAKENDQNDNLLSKNQLIGLKYYEELKNRIPRGKVTKMFEIVKQKLAQIVQEDSYDIECCGSYRRNRPDCGDMDIILTRKDGVFQKKMLYMLIEKLQQSQFLTDHLTLPRFCQENDTMSYMGICQFQQKGQQSVTHHRIDIKNYPKDMYAFAILYFTGSDLFNQSMRSFAKKKELMLNDKGLFKLLPNGQADKNGYRVKCHTEKQIFQALGLDYKTPVQRSI